MAKQDGADVEGTITFRQLAYEGGQSKKEFAGRGYKVPNGGVFTTANDLARFIISLTADTDPLARNYRDMMQTIQTSESNDRGYGFGLNIANNDKGLGSFFLGIATMPLPC